MRRVIWMLLSLISLQTPAFALDIWCSSLMGASGTVPPISEAAIHARAAGMRANLAFRRPFDFEAYLRHVNALAIQPMPECREAVFTGRIEAADVGKIENFVLTNPVLSKVFLASPGGDLSAAMKIGRLFRSRSIETAAPWIVGAHSALSKRVLFVLANSARDGAWRYEDPINPTKPWSGSVCDGPNCLCASACFVAWAGGVKREGDALGLHRPALQDQYLVGVSPQEAQAQFQEAIRLARLYFAEMEVPQYYIEKMLDTNKDRIYLVGEDLSEYNRDPSVSYRGLGSYPPSIRDWVEASCHLISYHDLNSIIGLVELKANSLGNPRFNALYKTLLASNECESVLWSFARRKNSFNWDAAANADPAKK